MAKVTLSKTTVPLHKMPTRALVVSMIVHRSRADRATSESERMTNVAMMNVFQREERRRVS